MSCRGWLVNLSAGFLKKLWINVYEILENDKVCGKKQMFLSEYPPRFTDS